jgi:hypothetical protein
MRGASKMSGMKAKFETPRRRWRLQSDGTYVRDYDCGSAPLCRRGKARFKIVQFMPWAWVTNALDAASGSPRKTFWRCS